MNIPMFVPFFLSVSFVFLFCFAFFSRLNQCIVKINMKMSKIFSFLFFSVSFLKNMLLNLLNFGHAIVRTVFSKIAEFFHKKFELFSCNVFFLYYFLRNFAAKKKCENHTISLNNANTGTFAKIAHSILWF